MITLGTRAGSNYVIVIDYSKILYLLWFQNFDVIVIVIFCIIEHLFQLQSITVRFISQTT